MDKIILQNTLPEVFKNNTQTVSDIWLKNVEFEKGKNYLVEAGSGSGKSSLCSFIYGYRADYSGDIIFNNQNVKGLKKTGWDKIRCQELSLLFQELCLFPELTALENVMLKNNLRGYKSNENIEEMFVMLGIIDKKNSLVGKMSWGQQQRVAVIRCLCQPFDFLILDEPISHLDDTNAICMSELIQKEIDQQGAGIIVTSIGKHLPLQYFKKLTL